MQSDDRVLRKRGGMETADLRSVPRYKEGIVIFWGGIMIDSFPQLAGMLIWF